VGTEDSVQLLFETHLLASLFWDLFATLAAEVAEDVVLGLSL
jgi:hypothetical protein